MLKGFIGIKVGMTQGFDTHGRWVPITVVKTPKNVIYQLKNKQSLSLRVKQSLRSRLGERVFDLPKGLKEADQHEAAQIGLPGRKNVSKSQLGLAKKLNVEAPKLLREVDFSGDLKVGEEINVKEVIRVGELVDIRGVSKGKGFAGGMKRHGFHGGPRTHGQSDRPRSPGSIGSGTTPGRVYKGKRMAGHMGADNVTVKNLEILEVDGDNETIKIKGALPGPNKSFVLIIKTGKKTKAYVEPEVPQMPAVSDQTTAEESDGSELSAEPKETKPETNNEGGEKENS